jgi:ATP-dependent DNA ligase
VRNGFVPQLRRAVATGLMDWKSTLARLPTCRSGSGRSGALTNEEMKNCVQLKPELVARVEFAEWTPDGHLRHSKFIGLREDKEPRDVVRESA